MFIDYENQLSLNQAITADAASTNAVDLGASSYGYNGNQGMVLAVQVTEAFNNLTTLEFQLQCDADSAFGSPRTLTKLSVALADLTLGARFSLPLPLERVERYVRAYYDVTGTNPSTGKLRAWLTEADFLELGR